jgi:hypothetical protein
MLRARVTEIDIKETLLGNRAGGNFKFVSFCGAGRKAFFFGKKKQKTFVPLSRRRRKDTR